MRREHSTYRRPVLDHLGLVAGRFDALGMGDVLDYATRQNPDRPGPHRRRSRQREGAPCLGLLKQALSLVPRVFHNKPTSRVISPRGAPPHLNAAALGRALDTLSVDGVTERDSLIAATAAERLGLTPRVAHLESPRFHVDGRSNSDEEPADRVVPITRGDRRDHRPDRNQVM